MPLPMLKKEQKGPLEGIKNIVAVAAGKGGVGKSSVTVNLALALKKLGYSVGILDADIYGPSIRRMLPEDSLPIQNGTFFTPAVSQGIKMISMSFFRKENEAAAVRAPIANGLITQFLKNVNWGELDYLLIDFPPGTGDIQLTLAQQANLSGAIMVATPQEVALMDVRKAMNLFDQVKVPIVGVIENMSYFTHPETNEPLYLFGKGGGERLAREGGVPFLGMIPIDPEISLSCDTGKSLFNLDNQRPSVQAFMKLADQMVDQVSKIQSLVIERLVQEGPCNLSIHWTDGSITTLCYSNLQKECPCANCNDENTGERLLDPKSVKEDVGVSKIEMVGRYALRFQFTSGCTTGIFPFDMLRENAGRPV
jgi:ATP-binding protein involved in chromosome partitioning